MNFEEDWYEYCLNEGLFNNASVLKDMPIYIIKKYSNKLSWNVLTNVNSYDTIFNNLDLPWVFQSIGNDSNYLEIKLNNLHLNWDLARIDYSLVSWDIISKNLNKQWCWKRMHLVKDINLDIFRSFSCKDWNYTEIIKRFINELTTNDLLLFKNKDVYWITLSNNKELNNNFNIVYTNKNENWDWGTLSTIIKFDLIKKHPELPWKWDLISSYNCTWCDYIQNPDLPWEIDYFEMNRNMTLKNLKTLKNWRLINDNKRCYVLKSLEIDKEEFIRNKMRQFFMKEGICEELVKKVLHPDKLKKFIQMGYESEEFNYIYGNTIYEN
jgi:hypothetical protein